MSCGLEGKSPADAAALLAALQDLALRIQEPRLGTGIRARTSAAAPREHRHAITANATETHVLNDGDWVQVLDGADQAVQLLFDTGGQLLPLRARIGVPFRLPHRRVWIKYDAGLATGAVVHLLQGDGEPPPAAVLRPEWTPYFARELGVGNAEPVHTLPAGFDYEIDYVSVLLDCDATVANRTLTVAAFPPGAVAGDHPVGHSFVDAAITAGQEGLCILALGNGIFRYSDTGVDIIRPATAAIVEQIYVHGAPAWRGRVEAAAASPNFASKATNGVVGDSMSMFVSGRRRPIF